MSLKILLGVLGALLLVTLPFWPWSRRWGYGAACGIGLLLLLIVWMAHAYVL